MSLHFFALPPCKYANVFTVHENCFLVFLINNTVKYMPIFICVKLNYSVFVPFNKLQHRHKATDGVCRPYFLPFSVFWYSVYSQQFCNVFKPCIKQFPQIPGTANCWMFHCLFFFSSLAKIWHFLLYFHDNRVECFFLFCKWLFFHCFLSLTISTMESVAFI